jgi:hypothetical protein
MNEKTYLEKYQKIVDLIEKEFPQNDKCKVVLNVQYSHDWSDACIMKGHTNQRFELRVIGEVDTKEEEVNPLPKTNITYDEFIKLLNENGIKETGSISVNGHIHRRSGVVGNGYSNGDNVKIIIYPSIFGEKDSVTIFCNNAGYQPFGYILQSNDVEFSIMKLVKTHDKNNGWPEPTGVHAYVNKSLLPLIEEKAKEIKLRTFVDKLMTTLKKREISKDELETMIYIFLIPYSDIRYLPAFIQTLEAYPNPWTFVSILNGRC